MGAQRNRWLNPFVGLWSEVCCPPQQYLSLVWMVLVTTQQNIVAHKIGKSPPFWYLNPILILDLCSALGTQALLEAVVHYDQSRVEKQK